MYRQALDPVSHSLGVTSIFAGLPLVALFLLLGVFRLKAQWAALTSLGVGIVVALAVYRMPVGQAGDTAAPGRGTRLAALRRAVVRVARLGWSTRSRSGLLALGAAAAHGHVLRRGGCRGDRRRRRGGCGDGGGRRRTAPRDRQRAQRQCRRGPSRSDALNHDQPQPCRSRVGCG
jgi:hypothetical protein